ncbi:hypothetical protein AALD74_10185 [Lachnospiraceae bacterium 48-21]
MKKDGLVNYTHWRNNTLLAKMKTDKKYIILKMGDSLIATGGLGWYILYTLCGIRFAVENDYIPVVDWKNCKLPQYPAINVGKENVWEYYFEQPFNINIDEAYKSKDYCVIEDVSSLAIINLLDIRKFVDFFDKDAMKWREYFQKYIRINQKLKDYFDICQNEQGLNVNNDLIGVIARGTDYKDLKPVGHLQPISSRRIFDEIDNIFGELEQKKIFLATEDKSILQKFEEKYPGKISFADAKRYENLGENTLNTIYKEEDGYDRDLKYLYSLYTISKSSIGIYSACGGGVIASLMRESTDSSYKFLYKGYNRAKGIIVGSYIEKKCGKLKLMGNKPIMFYALNTLKLLRVEEVDVIISNQMKKEYEKLIGTGIEFGMMIHYIISDSYNVVEYMKTMRDFMSTSKLILLYSDYFVHGKDMINELTAKVNAFDGAYVWGVKNYYLDDTESIKINNKSGIPERAFNTFKQGNYSLMGKYVFDKDLKEIIKEIKSTNFVDILNEYIDRKKLFFLEYKRGIIYSKILDENILAKTNQVINLLEDLQGYRIGDFLSYKKSAEV